MNLVVGLQDPFTTGADSDDRSGVLWNALFMRVGADCMQCGQPNHGWQLCLLFNCTPVGRTSDSMMVPT